MQDVINRIMETLNEKFSGTTVGDGGTFSGSGSFSLSGTGHGPFNIDVNLNQWEDNAVTLPGVNFKVIQQESQGAGTRFNSGKSRGWFQFLISVDQQKHGQSVAGVLDFEMRNYLRDTRFQPSGTGKEVYVETPESTIRNEGQELFVDFTVLMDYFS